MGRGIWVAGKKGQILKSLNSIIWQKLRDRKKTVSWKKVKSSMKTRSWKKARSWKEGGEELEGSEELERVRSWTR
jgi:hypothetical protein